MNIPILKNSNLLVYKRILPPHDMSRLNTSGNFPYFCVVYLQSTLKFAKKQEKYPKFWRIWGHSQT